MTGGPLAGVRIVEAGRFASAPSCATLLADWGADVVKLEPPTGDPARGPGSASGINPRFELHNRGRRSLALDLTQVRGRQLAMALLDRADVFVTNMRPKALTALELDWERLHERIPRLVFGHISGYGTGSSASQWPSYDHGAFWSYSGAARSFAAGADEPPQPAGGLGDRTAATALAAGIMATLFERERTGVGRLVNASLLGAGFWLMGSDVSDALQLGHVARPPNRAETKFPTMNCYRSADARWFWLQMMIPERHWSAFLDALDARWLDDDDRFRGGGHAGLAAHGPALVELLDGIFAMLPFAVWQQRFEQHGVWYAPVNTIVEALAADVTRTSGAVVDVRRPDGSTATVVASPCGFDGCNDATAVPAPRVGQHSAEVLTELGVDVDEISALAAAGIVNLG